MAYEILHGNVRETYKTIINTIPKDWDLNIPLEFETLLSYDSSGIHNYCMMPVLTPEGMMLLRTVCAPKRKALSTSYFVHKQVLPCTAEALHSSFEEKLGAPFYSEEDFDRIADNEHPVQPSQRWAGDEVSIDPQVLRSVLHGIINRWRSGRAVVAVGVPEGFDYDRYCYGAIRKIYGYLPALIRGMAGFMTYPGSDEIPLDVALVFRPEGTGDRLLSLDHETELSRSFLDEYIPDPFKNMIDTILKRDEAQRAEYLDMIFRYVEKSENENAFTEVKPSHYIKFLEYQDIFEKVRTQEQFDRQVEICGKLDTLSEQMRRQFLDGLDERIPLDTMDAFGLSLSQEVDTFQAYVEHIASVDQLVSHSTALLEHTKSKLWEAFRAALDNKPLPELQIQLQNLDKNNPPSFYAQCAEEMARDRKSVV